MFKFTSLNEIMADKEAKDLEWPSQSLDLKEIEMLYPDLVFFTYTQKLSNEAELNQLCQEKWATSQHNRLIYWYNKWCLNK